MCQCLGKAIANQNEGVDCHVALLLAMTIFSLVIATRRSALHEGGRRGRLIQKIAFSSLLGNNESCVSRINGDRF